MSPAIILGVAVLAGLFCPLHMWWSHRRGRQTACCPAARNPDRSRRIEDVRAGHERLRTMIAAHDPAVAIADRDEASAEGIRG